MDDLHDLHDVLRRTADHLPARFDDDVRRQVGERAAGRRRTRRRAATVGGVALLALVVGLGALAWPGADRDGDGHQVATTAGDRRWRKAAPSPLAPRMRAMVEWTGNEIIVVGGDAEPCPPSASCVSRERPFADGAAYDPITDTWRNIADPPAPFGRFSDAVVVGTDVFVLTSDEGAGAPATLLRYAPAADTWDVLPAPSSLGSLVTDGEHLWVVSGSHETGVRPDQAFDPAAGAWWDLPADPIGPSYDRRGFGVDGRLYVVGKTLVDQPGAEEPSLNRAAVFDGGAWSEVALADSRGSEGVLDGRGVIVDPASWAGDGSDVGRWDVPHRWALDTRTNHSLDLPLVPESEAVDPVRPHGTPSGLSAVGGAGMVADGQVVLDVARGTWLDLDAPDGVLEREGIGATWAGDRLAVFGGLAVEEPFADSTFAADLWLWEPTSSPTPRPGTATTASTESTSAPTTTTALGAGDPDGPASTGWRTGAEAPFAIDDRSRSFAVGDEIMVIRPEVPVEDCPPNASCLASFHPIAAYDAEGDRWRDVALYAPYPFEILDAVVAEGALHVQAVRSDLGPAFDPALLAKRYDATANRWVDVEGAIPGGRLVGTDAGLYDVAPGDGPDRVWTVESGAWQTVPTNPLRPAQVVDAVGVGRWLVLRGADGSVSAYDGGDVWTEVPVEITASTGLLAAGDRYLVAVRPGATGLVADLETHRAEAVPAPPTSPSVPWVGPSAGDGHVLVGASVLDLDERDWRELDLPDHVTARGSATAIWAGDRLVVLGAEGTGPGRSVSVWMP